jgi:hypothetical protein
MEKLTHEDIDRQINEALNPTKTMKSFAEKQGIKKTLLNMAQNGVTAPTMPIQPKSGQGMVNG